MVIRHYCSKMLIMKSFVGIHSVLSAGIPEMRPSVARFSIHYSDRNAFSNLLDDFWCLLGVYDEIFA